MPNINRKIGEEKAEKQIAKGRQQRTQPSAQAAASHFTGAAGAGDCWRR